MDRLVAPARPRSRRRFLQGSAALAGLGLMSGCGILPPSLQSRKVPRIGFIGTSAGPGPNSNAFEEGLRDVGWVNGENVIIEYRWAAEKVDSLPGLAAELVDLQVDVIAATGPANQAAKAATGSIPIVMLNHPDPVGGGLIASLARPGGNVTGMSHYSPQLSPKRLELLKAGAPRASRFAVLWNPNSREATVTFRQTQEAARTLGVRVDSLEVRSPEDFEVALQGSDRDDGACIVLDDPLTFVHGQRIAELLVTRQVPSISERKPFVVAGGLMSYSANILDLWRRAVTYIDKILKGAKPADLPVELPTKFDFILNLKTAQALSLTIPPSVVQQATELIQ